MRQAAVPPFVTAFLYLAIGTFVLRQLRPRDKNALSYSLWMFTTVYWQLGWAVVFSLQDAAWVPLLIRLNYSGIVFIPVAFYHLFVTFLDARSEMRWLKTAYGAGFLFAIACWIDGWMLNGFYTYAWGYYARAGLIHPFYLLFLTTLVVRVLFLLIHTKRPANAGIASRKQLLLLRWAFICYLPAAFDFSVNYGFPVYPIGFVFTLISLTLVSYAIIKHQLFDIRLIVRKTLVYSAVTLVLTTVYVFALVIIARTLGGWSGIDNIYLSAAAAALITILVHPVRARIQEWVDRRFPRESLSYALLREATGKFAHEIKGPLVKISLPAQLALCDLDDFESNGTSETLRCIRDRLNFILEQSHEAAQKIEAVRELSMEATPHHTTADLGKILTCALSGEEERLDKAGVHVELNLTQNLPPVLVNSHQLEIAFANIIRNAGEAMRVLPVGQRILKCDARSVRNGLEITITDSGPGIRQKELDRLFDPWFSTKGSHGMGIGLYLTQEIIHRHCGSIEATSAEGQGSSFRIIIPVQEGT